jgi:hypothetical protein
MRIHRPVAATALTAVMIAMTAGGAYAYWAVTGAGTGTATVGQIKMLEIHQSKVEGLMLDTRVALDVSVKNPNDFQVSLKGLKGLVVTGDVDRDHRGCKFETNFKITPPVLNPAITVIGGRESVSFKGGSITLTNDPNINQIACQGATVNLSYVLK